MDDLEESDLEETQCYSDLESADEVYSEGGEGHLKDIHQSHASSFRINPLSGDSKLRGASSFDLPFFFGGACRLSLISS